MIDETTENVLSELEKTQKDFWNVARETANFLSMLIKIRGVKSAIEIGTSNGYSGIWLGKALKETGGHLTTIEFYEKRYAVAQENFKKCGVADVITIVGGSACSVLEKQDFEVDFAFIDANKGEYIKYFELLAPRMKKGAIITADNVLSHPEKVKPFVDKIMSDKSWQAEILPLPAGLLVGIKLD